MSELSREQVEARLSGAIYCGDDGQTLLDAVVAAVLAMLAQARAEGAAAVVADVEAALEGWVFPGGGSQQEVAVRAVLARYGPSDVGPRPTPRLPDPGRGRQRFDGEPVCGRRGVFGRMVCQLRRGHDGPHEDWRDAARPDTTS